MITFTGESIRLGYTASRFQTGLTIKIDIWDNEMSKLVDGDAMTELAKGFYYYDYSPSSPGIFSLRAYATDGVSPLTKFETFKVHGRQSPLYSRRGGSGVIVRDENNTKTLERLEKKIINLSTRIDEVQKNITLIPLEIVDPNSQKVLKEVSELKIHVKEMAELQLKNIGSNILAGAYDDID